MKRCFKCGAEKELTGFYPHPMMKDGHLNKCKECTKLDQRLALANPGTRERRAAYERERFKQPHRKAKVREYQKARRDRNPDRDSARRVLAYAVRSGKVERQPCETCGDINSQAHHLDYTRPLAVRWLCFKHHRMAHGQVVLFNPNATSGTPAEPSTPTSGSRVPVAGVLARGSEDGGKIAEAMCP